MSAPIDGVTKKRERFDPLPHGKAPCPRCDGDDACRFCDGSGIVGDASCWTRPCENAEPLRCALCGQAGPKLGKLPELAGVGWKPGTAFHPYCSENLAKYGAR